MVVGIGRSRINGAEGAHLNNMNTFGADEHLRGNGAVGSSIFEANDGLEIPKFLDRRPRLT